MYQVGTSRAIYPNVRQNKHKDQHKETVGCRRYEQAGKSAAFVEAEIQKFRDLSDEILMEENTATVCFLRLDCGSLKQVHG